MAKEIFAPEKCPQCGKTTEVEHYDTGWRVVCPCGYYGIFHFVLSEEYKRGGPMGIKVSKAIELLMTDIQHPTASFMPDLVEAEKLGIQTLRYYKEMKRLGNIPRHFLLPGEDPEK